MRKVETFTNDKVKVIIIWNTRKIQPLFNNKDFIYLFFYLFINLYKVDNDKKDTVSKIHIKQPGAN